ncbi:uracil-DNA glycosylase [Candidatus Bathyarchaeota archaeon]|nr:uracil-DNA glycosylase [Candidatus Bathyarchaeota archaeon]
MSKQELMDELVAELRVCRRCSLWTQARNVVSGEGNLDASVVLVGEAPGRQEDIMGRPFVGAAGKLLDELLTSIKLTRAQVYITNLVKHRPPGNRDPRPDEINACSRYLDRQIIIVKPRLIITLGRHASRYILSRGKIRISGITKTRGKIYNLRLFGIPVRVATTLHPAAALYNPNYRSLVEEDFHRIRTILSEPTQPERDETLTRERNP